MSDRGGQQQQLEHILTATGAHTDVRIVAYSHVGDGSDVSNRNTYRCQLRMTTTATGKHTDVSLE